MTERRLTSRQTIFRPDLPPNKGAMSIDDMLKAAFSLGTGHSIRDVCQELSPPRSPATIHKLKQRAMGCFEKKETAEDYTRPILGHFIAFCLFTNPEATGKEMAEKARTLLGIEVSKATVNRIAKEMHFDSVLSQKQEKLTPEQKAYRVHFCLSIPNWNSFNLPWIFSDETMIVLNPQKRRVRIIRGVDAPGKYIETVGYPTKLMVWGAIGLNFKSDLIRITGTLNAQGYQNLLENSQVFEKLNERYGPNGYVFQQDGARPHTAASTLEFLQKKGVLVLPKSLHWPAMSPDMNVIENLWAILKSSMRYDAITNEESLYNEALRVWNDVTIEIVNAMISDFQPRMQACLAVQGECLNRYKSVVRGFRKSADAGWQAAQEAAIISRKIQDFREASQTFFTKISNGQNVSEVSQEGQDLESTIHQIWVESCKICETLPISIRQKCRLPWGPKARCAKATKHETRE